MGYMGDNDVWDIFCDVMAKKRDYLTISHITLGLVWFCTKVNVNDGQIFGGTMTEHQLIFSIAYNQSMNTPRIEVLRECA